MSKKYPTPLHILIDGSDNLGKTTVINLLSRKLDLPIIKMPDTAEYIEKGNVEEFSKFFNKTLVQFAEFDFIMDRGFTSSRVYSKVFKRETDLSYISMIEQKLKPQVFIFTGIEEGTHGNFSFHPDLVWEEKEKENIDLEYYNLAREKGYDLICVKDRTPQEICNEIIELIDHQYE